MTTSVMAELAMTASVASAAATSVHFKRHRR
jgi:hypothetical protein